MKTLLILFLTVFTLFGQTNTDIEIKELDAIAEIDGVRQPVSFFSVETYNEEHDVYIYLCWTGSMLAPKNPFYKNNADIIVDYSYIPMIKSFDYPNTFGFITKKRFDNLLIISYINNHLIKLYVKQN